MLRKPQHVATQLTAPWRGAAPGGAHTMLSCTQYWMLMSPTTLSALASLGVQSRMTSRHSAAIVCGGMLHAESPARRSPGSGCAPAVTRGHTKPHNSSQMESLSNSKQERDRSIRV